jgi:hypothetical protein
VALNRVGANCHPSHAHPGPTWQILSREMQVFPQALPTWQILQQVCEVEVERPVRPAECEEGAAQRVPWMAAGNGWAAGVDDADGDAAKAGVISNRRRTTRVVRRMPLGSLSVRGCTIRLAR